MGIDPITVGIGAAVLGGSLLHGKKQASKMEKKQKAAQEAANKQLSTESNRNAAKRKALFETGGGVLGEEVENVGATNRGTLFGN
jgi:hypothetical protein